MANEQAQTGLPIGNGLLSNGNKIRTGSIALGDGIDATTFAATKDTNTLRAALVANNAGYFTAARLNSMTKNDLMYSWLQINGYKA